ncbi:hypothetical protein CKO28_08685 [Rhodovibrio sodomensis]|uniref:Secreted protein n=1 Tax=Rhodovibrio sodomensis TaxID=1088 RepID=A0ABS1DDS1_9PROT|nr:hypothetical protein [Rhodovibrio sodomensis]MBK1668111.1 hypothetical protein [Rhodovibrio sodomensis]
MRTHRRIARPLTAGLAGLVAAAALTAGPALAQNRIICSQPVKPTCVNSDITYEDPQGINRCERDVEHYSQSVEDYLSCLQKKQNAQEEALKQLRKTFRCKANDDVEC